MAEAVGSALLQVVIGKLASPILERCGLLWGLDKEIENLKSTLSSIQAVLEDAEERPVKSKALQNWLGKLKDVAYDADDILDEFAIEVEEEVKVEAKRRKVEIGDFSTKVCNFFSPSNPLVSRLHMGDKIKEIGRRLDAIAEERSKFHLREGEPVLEIRGREPTDSFVIESDVYGREEDKKKVMELLISDNREDVTVIPIVGMGGLGKTTLAQLAYNDERAAKHFELRMWVCVSDDFSVSRVTKDIIESATNNKCDLENMELLQRRLREQLSGKKFLLVLDDVWDEDPSNWNHLKPFLRAGARGSKIIVTTRSEDVASIMGTLNSQHLLTLSDDHCWSLFKQQAFGHGRPESPNPNLEMLGREILKKCGGIPLAVKTLGSLMRNKTEEQWLFIKDSEIWNLTDKENHILPALRLSYYHLPSHLKQCFEYCSIFPKDYQIEKKKLIQLWMAEGFIQSSKGNIQMEDIGGEYFNNLLSRSFFQDAKKDVDGNIVRCKFHDLMHDLACSVAGNECSILTVKNAVNILNISCRRLSLDCEFSERVLTVPRASRKENHLRTLLQRYNLNPETISPNVLVHFRYLRVLDLNKAKVSMQLLVSIGELKHLRFLDLSYTNIKALPESFSSLPHLETLRLVQCCNLEELPRDMSRMTSLRHLEISGCYDLTHMPVNIGELKFLQTLPIFNVGQDRGCGITELKDLNLRGSLIIQNLENVMCAADAQEANLKEKQHLRELHFLWDIDLQLEGNVEQTLTGLHPHQNLKKLVVGRYLGVRFPHWMSSSSLSNLVEISLINCRRCEQLPSLGQLRSLKFLMVRGMDAVERIDNHFYGNVITQGFPSLKKLTLEGMCNLEEWSGFNGRELLPCLKQLLVNGCPKLRTLPVLANLSSLCSLEIEGLNELRLLPDGLFRNNTHLSKLSITDCTKLESLSGELGSLAALESLDIWNCDELVSLPEELQNLPSLRSLRIKNCNRLTSLRLQGLSSLQHLTIHQCQSQTSLMGGMQHLTALQSLSIYSCLELASLLEGMQHLFSLQRLRISKCEKITSLPEGLQHSTTQRELSLGECPTLTALPEWIGNLYSNGSTRVDRKPVLAPKFVHQRLS